MSGLSLDSRTSASQADLLTRVQLAKCSVSLLAQRIEVSPGRIFITLLGWWQRELLRELKVPFWRSVLEMKKRCTGKG